MGRSGGRRIVSSIWYAVLLGFAVIIFERVFGGLTGGLKTGLGKSLGI